MKGKILLIDDDADLHELVRFVLTRDGYAVTDAFDAAEGLKMVEREAFDLALIDVMMPGMDGLQMLDRIRTMRPALPVILVTGVTLSPSNASEQAKHIVLAKPFDIDDLRRIVQDNIMPPV